MDQNEALEWKSMNQMAKPGNGGYASYFQPEDSWHSSLFKALTYESPNFKISNWARPFLVCAPCLLAGWSESCQQREGEKSSEGIKFGLGPKGRRVCLWTCAYCACFPALACMTVRSRSRLMDTYGIRGGFMEQVKGVCCPCALFQHLIFLREHRAGGSLRFHWATGKMWSVKDRPESPAFKILVLGSAGVGKSSLFNLLLGQPFPLPYQPDCQANIGVKAIHIASYPTIMVELWDIPASTKVEMKDVFFKDAKGAFVLFEMDSYITWKEAKTWTDAVLLQENASNTPLKIPITLVGSKSDVCPSQDCRFLSEVLSYKEQHENMNVAFISSWRKEGISNILQNIALDVFNANTDQFDSPQSSLEIVR